MAGIGRPLILAALLAAAPAHAQSPADADADAETRGDGPYPAVMETDPAFPNHVIYRPRDLAKLGTRRLGVLVWGNGACSNDGASARRELGEIASWGYLVIAPGRVRSGPTTSDPHPPYAPLPPGGKRPAPETTTEDVRAGIGWAVAENARKGSRYHGRIDPHAIAVGGHSCGGLQAIALAADPRVKSVLIQNSGVYNNGVQRITGMIADKAALDRFHTPVIYILGGEADMAYPNGTDDYRRIAKVPAVLLNLPVGHGGTFARPQGGAAAHVAVDWLEWTLFGDKSAARTFTGANCRLCSGTDWTIERKNGIE